MSLVLQGDIAKLSLAQHLKTQWGPAVSYVNPQTSHTWKHLYTGFTRRDSQCHCASSFPAHQAFLYGQSAAKPAQQHCEEARIACATAHARALWEPRGIQQNAGRECRGWAGRWQCRAGHWWHRRHLFQGYSSLPAPELLTAPACPDLLHAFRDGYAADGHFPSSSLTEPINSTWLHNTSLMPEEFAEPADDAVLFD